VSMAHLGVSIFWEGRDGLRAVSGNPTFCE
jgi:hypothetical protein